MDLRDVRIVFAFGRRGGAWCNRDLGIFQGVDLQAVLGSGTSGLGRDVRQ